MRATGLPPLFCVAVLAMLSSAMQVVCGQVTPSSWQAESTFYEIFVRSFKDSDGDGIGDFQGILSQLDYLNDGDSTTTDDLGVTGIWLMPINPSPSYHGYDVTDYFAVNPEYGTLSDFQDLLDACHTRGIRVIVDFVGNHSSSQHPRFVASASSPSDPYRDWYVWSDIDPGGDWHWGGNGWYYGLFWSGMPDWNVQNAAVVDYHYDIVDHWLAMGVDGFRFDAVKHLVNEGGTYENHPGTFAYLEAFRNHYLSVNPEAICVGEAWTGSDVIAQYGPPHQDMCFEFGLSGGIISSVNGGDGVAFRGALDYVLDVHQAGAFAPFLSNHDQDRVMSQLGGDVDKAKLAAAVLLTLPGTPFLYYGEEIGMTGAGSHPVVRTPMQWEAGFQGGFTTGTPWSGVQPDVDAVNVTAQDSDASSLLSTYREFIHLRNAEPALRRGETITWDTGSGEVVACLRTLGDQRILVVHNFSGAPQGGVEVVPSALCDGTYAISDLRSGADLGPAAITVGTPWSLPLSMGPRSTVVLRLTGGTTGSCTVPLTVSVDQYPAAPLGLGHLRYRVDGGDEQVVQMDADGAPGWFSKTLQVPEGSTVQWRFQSSQVPADVEEVPAGCGSDQGLGLLERTIQVGSTPVEADRVCFGGCTPCSYPAQQVTLKVDLGDLTPHPDGVHVAGSFQGWNPAGTPMVDEGGGVYSHTLTLGVGETILYKFINGAAWGGLEEIDLEGCGVPNGIGGWNRSLTVMPNTGVLPAVCFEECTPCTTPPGQVLTTFSVDMSLSTEANGGLQLEWNHPDSTLVPMEYNLNGIWTAVTHPLEGQFVEYRFVNGTEAEWLPDGCSGGAPGWRGHIVGTDFGEVFFPCFGACLPCSLLGGCTYTAALNYSTDAMFDDGSCTYAGCTDPAALNFHPAITVNDGTCIYPGVQCGPGTVLDAFGQCIPDPDCVEDINGDGQVGVADILLLLGSFGAICSP